MEGPRTVGRYEESLCRPGRHTGRESIREGMGRAQRHGGTSQLWVASKEPRMCNAPTPAVAGHSTRRMPSALCTHALNASKRGGERESSHRREWVNADLDEALQNRRNARHLQMAPRSHLPDPGQPGGLLTALRAPGSVWYEMV